VGSNRYSWESADAFWVKLGTNEAIFRGRMTTALSSRLSLSARPRPLRISPPPPPDLWRQSSCKKWKSRLTLKGYHKYVATVPLVLSAAANLWHYNFMVSANLLSVTLMASQLCGNQQPFANLMASLISRPFDHLLVQGVNAGSRSSSHQPDGADKAHPEAAY
jgi:hypothetical protein